MHAISYASNIDYMTFKNPHDDYVVSKKPDTQPNSAAQIVLPKIVISTSPGLSLLPNVPAESYQKEDHDDSDEFAAYTLIDIGMNNDGMHDLLKVVGNNEDCLHSLCYLPPRYDVSGGATLEDVYDYHVLGSGRKGLHPTLFVVVQYPDHEENGVLLVNLNTDLECSGDDAVSCRAQALKAVLAAMNLNIQ